ncbi:MAG TPA: hypothetical protein DCL54_12810, partial [Alphaproteobacteria bacterium]|nr:hypothetical protein [Alphaproteobacteria bacterium]
QYDTAYSLAAGHRIRYEDNLADFAEGEFLAGWIALQFQNKPDAALAHFRRLRQGVTAPISVARAHYWAGRALAKAGRDSDARAEYGAAGNLPLTFYGQLALQQISPKVRLSVPAGFKPGNSSAFRERPVIRAIWALADLGEQARLRTFVTSAADGLTDGQDYANLVQLVRDLGETGLALRVAKRGLQKNIPLFDLAYPTIPAPAFAGNGTAPETAMVLGLTRQESEFDSQAISRANAQGLMQLIPSTARMTAKRHGLPYDGRNTLLDPTGNMRLGMAHLSDVIADFAGSYVMAIGAYNAGGGRINEWVGRFGDPRAPNVDVVDWIERVPFSETRNYIQRVLENTQVYRAILNGREAPMTLAADLKRGTYTTLAAAQFTSDPNSQRASSPPAPQVAAIRSSPIVPDEDEKRPQIDPKPKAEPKAKSAKESKAKPKAKGKSKAKAQAKAGAKKAKPNARVEATPKCKPGSKSAQCRKGRPG